MPLDRPIPAFYCCYLLRSTVRHANVYVGSTPNPVRRLRQHNGLAKGGAVRTSRDSSRPWEMSCIVSGFPSHIAALQFEWAWQNPHITLHIPPESRIQHATQKKRSGQPKRPRHSVTSLLSNLHLLLRVPSFSRWPLEVRFFSEDVHKAWSKWSKSAVEPLRESIKISQDFPPYSAISDSDEESPRKKRRKASPIGGINALQVDYSPQKAYVEKAKEVIDFEMEGDCAVCKSPIEHDSGIHTVCSNSSCKSVSHVTCLSKHFLQGQDEGVLLPIQGTCPSCKTELKWADIVKELSLRMRGQREVEKLLKVKRVRKTKGVTASQVIPDESDEDSEADREMEEEMETLREFDQTSNDIQIGDSWHAVGSEDSDAESVISSHSEVIQTAPKKVAKAGGLKTVIEDSDWDDAIEL